MSHTDRGQAKGIILHFSVDEAQAQGEDVPRRSELVRKEAVLATMAEPAESTTSHPVTLAAGAHAELRDDGRVLVALASGYPAVRRQEEGGRAFLLIEIVPAVSVSSNRMRATIRLQPVRQGMDAPRYDEVIEMLGEEGVVYGIDGDALASQLANLSRSSEPLDILAARGMLPVHGRDAFFRFAVEIGPIAGKPLGNGKIDFRERRAFVAIEKDQLIATKVPATGGSPGRNVLGEILPAQPGRDITLPTSGDIVYLPQSGEVRARNSGILSIVNDTDIRVSAKHVINGDINYTTGNIESKNALEITGSVAPGFSVTARGDIVVGGNVQAAQIFSKGNVIVKGGLLGESSQIKARGDIDIAFLENGRVEAGGMVVIRRQSYYSTIKADGSIRCSDASRVVGGMLLSGASLTCGTVGAPNARPAILAAGVSSSRYSLYLLLQEREEQLAALLAEARQRHGEKGLDKPKFRKLAKEVEDVRGKLRKINFLPHTDEFSRAGDRHDPCRATISIAGSIAAGSRIRIGNAEMMLSRDVAAVIFALDDSGEEIRALSPNQQRGEPCLSNDG